MCRSPSVPAVTPPPAAQPLQSPQKAMKPQANRSPNVMGGGTLLTGPSGVTNAATARTTLLGQ